LARIEQLFPPKYRTYFEPFLGGGAVFFRLSPSRAILSDTNEELVYAFRAVRDYPDRLMTALDRHRPGRSDRDHYDKVRSQSPASLSASDRAARTIFLNKTCYNGLYRVNANGQFNVPFGKYKSPTLYAPEILLAAHLALRGKVIEFGDYRDMCELASEGDFVYLDPPYHPLSKTSSFTSYTPDAFGEADQEQLAMLFKRLDARGCHVMLSNSATPFIKSLYKEFRIEAARAIRAINSKGSGRGAIDEFLITNYG
jgi:DNA adenine methylase